MNTTPRQPSRGSVLIAAMILAVLVAIALTSYLSMSITAVKLADRTFYSNASLNLAETGLEQAIWSFNQMTAGSSTAWSSWTTTVDPTDHTTPIAYRKWTGFTYPQNTTGEVRVYVRNYNPAGSVQPVVVAESIITPPHGPPLTRMVQVVLHRRSLFAMGMVAKNGITFSGNNASVDSWNSDPDNDPATPPIPYSSGIAHDAGSIGSPQVVSAITVNNADIWGYASIGSPDLSGITVGPNGHVSASSPVYDGIDPSRVATDFSVNLENVGYTGPTPKDIGAITNSTTLPLSPADISPDGNYYYQVDGISFNNKTLTISGGNVVILMPTGYNISIGGGSGAVNIATGSTLAIYTPGDVSIAGNGVMNGGTTTATAQPAKDFQLYGTNTTSQSIQIAGNGVLSGIVYAPNASIKINGNGDVMGSYVGSVITVVGNAAFHYDESLANLGADNPFGIASWNELTSASDRSEFAPYLTF